MLKHYIDSKTILDMLEKNPMWISGYTTGEECFTASVAINTRARWGIWPQCEFNIAQSAINKEVLIAINDYFGKSEGVYIRKNGIGTVSFRDLDSLKTHIIPFFNKYPLLGTKSFEFETWTKLVQMLEKKEHTSDSLKSRDTLVKFLELSALLNARSTKRNKVKLDRNIKIVNWLNSLENIPTIQCKTKLLQSFENETKIDLV